MENLTVAQLLEEYPYLKRMTEDTIFTTEEDLRSLKKGEQIKIDNQDISVEVLRRIVQDDTYYDYASRFFNNDINRFYITYIINGDVGGAIYYNKPQIIKGMEQLILSKQLVLTPEEEQRYAKLKGNASFEKFLEKNKGNNYNIDIDGNKYSIPIEQIISLMQLSEEEFDRLCNDNEIKYIGGIPKPHLIYSAIKFFLEYNVFDEYVMPSVVVDRFNDIKALQKIDLQAINKHLETEDSKFREVQLDIDLEKAIIDGMPQDASDLEKAIYIYIKMCKILTYDDEYYAVDQKGEAAEKHENVSYVSSITPSNNKVVCFEFNLIYSKLLDKLGIKFKSDYKNMVGEAYGAGHANLEFRSGKYLVKADSVTSILQGDIMQAKLNQPLVGLRCMNINQNTQQEFKSMVSKIYELIAKQERQVEERQEVEHIQTFEEVMLEYSKTTTNLKEVDLSEKLSILIDKVNATKMVGIDSLSYVLQLRKILFNEQERQNNIAVTVIRNNEPFDPEKVAMASAIFTLNLQSFTDNPEQNIYYYFNPNKDLIPMSREELQEKFNNGVFEYVEKDDPRIPGIVAVGGIKK